MQIRQFLPILLLVALTGCATSSVTKVGSQSLPSAPETSDVLVFSKDSEVNKAFTTLGIVNYNNPGKYQILTLEDAMPELKKQARTIGANGLIIDQSAPVKSGIISTGITVKARAILINP